ncbi:zona pellucida sperm-binding protein 4-like isoform X1 [Poecilia formosa]|uniref:Zona pellucida sperm-binding protein 4-like n=2 Tax=Poecilia formosa TaxID=48698 RepID=A0A087X552_POEFO|nr:PREDICTED: zona pellucida sperm-binding protein 4-like isoform X1 [Poecilia formosa]XP_007560325.1 PREDICTED: zona pellucida sperm-binding protein 4-like isoform X1 [Poecilia formosa]
MSYNCMKARLVSLVLILMAQGCCCVSSFQGKEKRAQNAQLALPAVTCSVRGIKAVFGPLVTNKLHVRDVSGTPVPLVNSRRSCGVKVGKEKNQNLSFFSRYDSCYARIEGNKVVIPLMVQLTGENQWIRVNISCPLIKRSSQKTQPTLSSSPASLGECNADESLRLNCGHQSITSSACQKLGCCYDAQSPACYYRLDACSLDGHFVFTVKATDTYPPIDPSSLVIKDQPHCLPAISTSDTAVFKMGVMDCGAKMRKDGDLVIYEVEVEEQNKKRKRHSPFSLQVECEYDESDLIHAKDLRSLYTVTNPPAVVAQGAMRVQMRLATDSSFTTFIPEDRLPLKLPLRQTVNVEISIVPPSPDPTLSLRVRDCFAYPLSKHSVWTLLHDGCPNPLDTMRSSVPVDNQGKTTTYSQVRRFDVKTFAFLDPDTGKPSVEQMYFYCWVEICTEDEDCAQSCTIISSDAERQRRQTAPASRQVQLVSVGPLQLVHENADLDDLQCGKLSKAFRVMVYVLSGVGAALLLILLFALWSNIQRCGCKQRAGT